jgi:hypothetical protein
MILSADSWQLQYNAKQVELYPQALDSRALAALPK